METTGAIDPNVLDRIVQFAKTRQVAIASLSIDEIAAGLGVSRMTLYRRIGSRRALHRALQAQGHDPGQEQGARERALVAAAELIREGGVAGLTVDAVATRAQCALPTIYAQFGSRSGLLMAVFERHSPVLVVKNALTEIQPGDSAGFRMCVSHVYATVFHTVDQERSLLRALLAEALRDPSSEIDEFLVTRYLPSIGVHIVPWIADHMERGVIRRLPLLLVAQQFIAPIVLHAVTRPLVDAAGVFAMPSQTEVCDQFADLFCRAVEVPAGD